MQATTAAQTARAAPSPRGYPLLGHVPSLIRGGADYLRAIAANHGDIVELKLLGPMKMYLLSHPDYVRHVLQTNPNNYAVKRPSMHLEAMMGNGLTMSNGELWKTQHRLMQPAFQSHKIELMTDSTIGAVTAMLDEWNGRASAGPVDVAVEMEKLSLNILLRTLFGAGISAQESERIVKAVEFVLRIAGRGMFLEVPPFVPTPENLRAKQALRDLGRVIDGLIEQRRQQANAPATADLLSLLLSARDTETGAGMSDGQIRDEVTSVLVAGYETTAVAMTWMFYAISQNPDAERLLHQELDAVLLDGRFTTEALPRLGYMQKVIQESLRLYPPFWAMTRMVVADDAVGGFKVPKGALVVVSPYVTQRHPGFWEDPERFDPMRFSEERSVGRHKLAYFPFGAGPRICIGIRNAMLTLQITLALVARQFRLTLVEGHPVAVHTAMTIRPKHGMSMNLELRRPAKEGL